MVSGELLVVLAIVVGVGSFEVLYCDSLICLANSVSFVSLFFHEISSDPDRFAEHQIFH